MAKVPFKTQRPLIGDDRSDDEQSAAPEERQPAVPDPPPSPAAAADAAESSTGGGAAKKPRRRRTGAKTGGVAADTGPARGPRSISRTVSLPSRLWDKLQTAAGKASASSMLVLVLRAHAPKTAGDAGELLEGLLDADDLGRQEGLNVRLPADILDALDAHTISLREAGYSATEATRSNVIAAIVLAHAPDTPEAGRALVASERLARLR